MVKNLKISYLLCWMQRYKWMSRVYYSKEEVLLVWCKETVLCWVSVTDSMCCTGMSCQHSHIQTQQDMLGELMCLCECMCEHIFLCMCTEYHSVFVLQLKCNFSLCILCFFVELPSVSLFWGCSGCLLVFTQV